MNHHPGHARHVASAGLSLLLLAIALPAHGHYFWLSPDRHAVEGHQDITLTLGWGHEPGDETLSVRRMLGAARHDPAGQRSRLLLTDEDGISGLTLETDGWHILEGHQARGYWTRTVEGGKRGSLQEYPNASHCSYSQNTAKSYIQVGESHTGADRITQPLGHGLEIIPLDWPLDDGDQTGMRIQVLQFGEPLENAVVTAYGAEADQALTSETDAEGKSHLKLTASGRWLIHTESTIPFHDQSLCTDHSLNATLTFTR